MSGNNKSIQILRGGPNYDISESGEILLDGQPFYSKKTTEFFIGDGETPVSGLKPVKALTDQTYDSDSDVAQSGKAVAEAITPLTNEQIDDMWEELPALDAVPTFDMTSGYVPVYNGITFEDGVALNELTSIETTLNTEIDKVETNLKTQIDDKSMTFRYFSVPAGKFYPLKRNGTYMIYNGNDANGTEQTITLYRRSSGEWAEVFTGAKQASITTAVVAIEGRYTYQLCGMAYTGNSWTGVPNTDGFRQATSNYACITSAGKMYVCESVQGKPLSYKDTRDECIGELGEAYKE